MNRMTSTRFTLLCFTTFLLFVGCASKDEVTPTTPQKKRVLISPSEFPKTLRHDEKPRTISSNFNPLTKGLLTLALGQLGFNSKYDGKSWVNYDVEFFKIQYTATTLGEERMHSALVVLPTGDYDKKTPLPIFLGCHGTVLKNNAAPSNFSLSSSGGLTINSKNYSGFELYAALGSMVVLPDYAGLGIDSAKTHPYFIQDSYGQSNIEAIYAATEVAIKKGYEMSNDLYIGGYSEGGFVSLASAKFVEGMKERHFNLKEVYTGAGGYLPHRMITTILSWRSYHSYAFLFYVAKSYKTYPALTINYGDFVTSRFATAIDTLITGKKSADEVDKIISSKVNDNSWKSDIFSTSFISTPTTSNIYAQLRKNSFEGSSFNSNITFFHTKTDKVIPYKNTTDLVDELKKTGKGSIKFVELTDAGHGNAGTEMISESLGKFGEVAKLLK